VIDDVREIVLRTGERFVPEWPADALRSERFDEVEWRAFADTSGQLFGGTWEGEPGTLHLDPYPYHEICVMLTGRVALTDLEGGRREFAAGQAFYVPASFRGTWETIEPSTKIFIGFQPAQRDS
jgi:uncharacterized cupin superfamily protein